MKNSFIDSSFGKSSLKEPLINNYDAIQMALNELNIDSFKNSANGHLHSNPYNIEAKLIYVFKEENLSLAWNF